MDSEDKPWQKVKSLTQTCSACPSQWEGTLADGRMIYIRYRWGYLSVCVSPNPTCDVYDAVRGEEVFGDGMGGNLDGCLGEEEMLRVTGIKVEG